MGWNITFFVVAILMSSLNLCKCIYKFPVYTTKSCPRTEPEWCERSVALNCNETNGYMCIPNEEITALLEFCYFVKKLIIPRGTCLILSKHNSAVDGFTCRNFSFGCPRYPYFSNEIYKQQGCVSIGKGCFVAEPNCNCTEGNIKTNSYKTEGIMIAFGVVFSGFAFAVIYFVVSKKKYSEIPKDIDTKEDQKKIEKDLGKKYPLT